MPVLKEIYDYKSDVVLRWGVMTCTCLPFETAEPLARKKEKKRKKAGGSFLSPLNSYFWLFQTQRLGDYNKEIEQQLFCSNKHYIMSWEHFCENTD